MTGLVIAEAVAIGLLALLVAGLLRSHADILRALHELRGGPVEPQAAPHLHQPSAAASAGIVNELDFPGVREGVAPPRPVELAARVTDIAGVTPWDEAVAVGVAGDDSRTLVAFLSTGVRHLCGLLGRAAPQRWCPAAGRDPARDRHQG